MVQTSPHGVGDTKTHVNPEYDPNEDGVIEHSSLGGVGAEDHHNQVDDESGTFAQGATTESETTVAFGQSYVAGVGECAFSGALSPVADADAVIVAYTTDGNGDIDGMTIRAHNTTGAQETVRWRFAGRPA